VIEKPINDNDTVSANDLTQSLLKILEETKNMEYSLFPANPIRSLSMRNMQQPEFGTAGTDAFLTHNWGLDEWDRDNHERVVKINACLRKAGINTWLDERMIRSNGNIRQQMALGLSKTKSLIVFVTRRYETKINSSSSLDNCFLEFDYGTRVIDHKRIHVIVMEEQMSDPNNWRDGRLKMEIGSLKFTVISDEIDLEAKCQQIAEDVLAQL
jgi:hypothetical protein